MSNKLLLLTPPFTQLNTPYPATAYLLGYLLSKDINASQVDLGMRVVLRIFSEQGLKKLFEFAHLKADELSNNAKRISALKIEYISTIEGVISFLQGKNNMLAYQICDSDYLPQAGRFQQMSDVDWAFGSMGLIDKAKHLATLYLEDLSDFISEAVDPYFGFSRYAERLGLCASSFDELENALQAPLNFVGNILLEELEKEMQLLNPSLVSITIPFQGNLFGALRCGQYIKQKYPNVSVCMGGGYVNTELRDVSDGRMFKYTDALLFDDGERSLELYWGYVNKEVHKESLLRTYIKENGQIRWCHNTEEKDVPQNDLMAPCYTGLNLDDYLSVVETANPMFRLWSDGQWNKLTVAHGCYWGKCSFCDTSLDYISRYEPNQVSNVVDRMESLMSQTGRNGFHFVDEAAPPALLKEVALEILKRNLKVVWWTNIRFEKRFTPDLCRLLKVSGCLAVSGGLEVASERILKLINKGVTLEQVSQVSKAFNDAGILVHAYLMYGFPTQTAQETIDSLEIVRQLFENGCVDSGFWHQFAMTVHSDVGRNPEKYKVEITTKEPGAFANNDVHFIDPQGAIHEQFGAGLKKAIYNFMHGVGFDYKAHEWFDFRVPKTTMPHNYVANAIHQYRVSLSDNQQVIWLGKKSPIVLYSKNKKGKSKEMADLHVFNKQEEIILKVNADLAKWLDKVLDKCSVLSKDKVSVGDLSTQFQITGLGDFDAFLNSYAGQELRNIGLIVV